MPRVSFTAAEPTDFEPLPAGKYHMRIDDAKWESSKSSGNQQLRVVMCVLDQGAYFERQASEWITHSENTGWKFGQLAEAALEPDEYDKTESGNKDPKGRPTYNYDFDTDDLPGCEMMVQATLEEDNKGQARNRFRFIKRTNEVTDEEEHKDAVDAIAEAPNSVKVEGPSGPSEEPSVAEAPAQQGAAQPTRRRRLQA